MSSSTETVDAAFEPMRFDRGAPRASASAPPPEPEEAGPWGEIVVAEPEPEETAEPASGRDAAEAPVRVDLADVPLRFDEDELARACAGVARQAETAALQAAEREAIERRSRAVERFGEGLAAFVSRGDALWDELGARFGEVVEGLAAVAVPALMRGLAKDELRVSVREVLARFGPDERLRIRVAPELAEDLTRALGSGSGTVEGGARWEIEGDPGLEAGDFRIERRHGFLERRAAEICEEVVGAVRAVLGAASGREATRDGLAGDKPAGRAAEGARERTEAGNEKEPNE